MCAFVNLGSVSKKMWSYVNALWPFAVSAKDEDEEGKNETNVDELRARLDELLSAQQISDLCHYCCSKPTVAHYFSSHDCTDATYYKVQLALEKAFNPNHTVVCRTMLTLFGPRYLKQYLQRACDAAMCDHLRGSVVRAFADRVHDVWLVSDHSNGEVVTLLVRHRTVGDAFATSVLNALTLLGYRALGQTNGRDTPTAHLEPVGYYSRIVA